MDVCRWALGVTWPTRVSSNGGRYAFQDDWETPDTQTIAWDFAEGKSMSWEGRSCNEFPIEGKSRGTLIYGTEGTALLDGDDYMIYDKKKKIIKQAKGTEVVDPTNTVSGSGADMDTRIWPTSSKPSGGISIELPDHRRPPKRDPAASGQHCVAGRPRTALRSGQWPHFKGQRRDETVAAQIRTRLGTESLTRHGPTATKLSKSEMKKYLFLAAAAWLAMGARGANIHRHQFSRPAWAGNSPCIPTRSANFPSLTRLIRPPHWACIT